MKRFTGIALAYDLLCLDCAREADAAEVALVPVCAECLRTAESKGSWEGIVGRPEVLIGRRKLSFHHETVRLPELRGLSLLDLQPIEATNGSWLGCTSTGSLIEIDVIGLRVRTVAQVPREEIDFDASVAPEAPKPWLRGPRCVLKVSRNGEIAAVANTYGTQGCVVDLSSRKVTMSLRRDNYHQDVSIFPLALADVEGRIYVIHATAWESTGRLRCSDGRPADGAAAHLLPARRAASAALPGLFPLRIVHLP